MKAKELIPKKETDLVKEMKALKSKLIDVHNDIVMRKSKNYAEITQIKRDIARIMTVLREKQILSKVTPTVTEDKVSTVKEKK